MPKRTHSLLLMMMLMVAIILPGCGGGGSNGSVPVINTLDTLAPSSQQGGFQGISARTHHDTASIQTAINQVADGLGALVAEYPVDIYKLEYMTENQYGEAVRASGVLAIPQKQIAAPILSFQHATIFYDREAPSNTRLDPATSVETLLASQGMIVFSSDYVGYGSSKGQIHPYLQKEPSASAVIDLLSAGKAWLDHQQIDYTNELLMTGYSQGGYVTMAAFKQIEEEEPDLTVTAVVAGGGPYDLHTALDELIYGLNIPSFLQSAAIDYIADQFTRSDSDIAFDRAFLERFFANDRQDNVHNWSPSIPVKLFHGRDDAVVPIESAISTRDRMQTLGADVELIECSLSPAHHRACVPEYIEYTVGYFLSVLASNRLQ